MKKRWDDIKQGWKVYASVLLVAIFILILNRLTPYVADDYTYMYSFADGKKMTSIGQIFSSLWEHYMSVNGRIIPHFFVHLFVMNSKIIFDIVNTLFFIFSMLLIYRLTDYKKTFSVLVWFTIFIFIWNYTPAYGQVYLWLDGSINYSWLYLFALLYLLPYYKLYVKRELLVDRWKLIGLSVYTFFWGAYSESVSFASIFVSFLMTCTVMKQSRDIKKYLWYIVPVFTGAAGYLTMVFSPGETSHMSIVTMKEIINRLINIYTEFYLSQRTLLLLWAVLMALAIYQGNLKKEIMFSVFLMMISFISVSILCMGSYLEDRSLAAGSFFLIVSVVNLIQIIRANSRFECVTYCIGAYFIVNSLLNLWNGFYDVYDVAQRSQQREAYIYEQVEAGASEVIVSRIEGATQYSAKCGLVDIKTQNEDAVWPNKHIAKYYGLDMIYSQIQ